MDYEKKYKEALEIAKNINNEHRAQPLDVMTRVFPELKELEDEKIRKEIISALQYANHKGIYDKHLAWLEKQGESNFEQCTQEGDKIVTNEDGTHFNVSQFERVTKKESQVYETENGEVSEGYKVIEPKFHEGEWCINDEDGTIFQIVKVLDNTYTYRTNEGKVYFCTHYSLENDARLWTINDAKDGDVLFQDLMYGKTFIYNGVNPNMAILYSFIISNDGKDVLPYHIGKPNTGIGNIEENKNIIHPATKEQRDLLFQKMKERLEVVNKIIEDFKSYMKGYKV